MAFAAGEQVEDRGALQALVGQDRHQKPLHVERACGQLLGHPADHVGVGPASAGRHEAAAGHLLRVEDAVHRLARSGEEVERRDRGQVLEEPLLDLRDVALAGGALGHHAQEREAGPDRAVEGEALVPREHDVLQELAGGVLHLEAVLAGADALELARRHAHRLAVEEDLRPRAGRT